MRSQVQVLAGPPTILAGHSAAGREPGALAATLGRAGAARPSPPASPSGPPGPPSRAAGLTTTTHRGRHPGPDGSHAAGASTSRRSLILCLAPPPATRAPNAGLACLSLSGHAPPPYPTGARVRHRRPADQHASRQHRSRPGLLGRRPNRSTARQPTGTRPVAVVTGARRTDLGPMPPPGRGGDGTHPDRRGGHQPAGRWPGGHQRAGHRTGGQQATGPPDTWTTNPGDRTPDGLDTGRLDRRSRTRYRMGGHPMLDTARRPMPWLASWPCRPGRRCLTAGCRLDALPGRRRLGEQQPRPSAAGDTPPSSWRLGALLSSEMVQG